MTNREIESDRDRNTDWTGLGIKRIADCRTPARGTNTLQVISSNESVHEIVLVASWHAQFDSIASIFHSFSLSVSVRLYLYLCVRVYMHVLVLYVRFYLVNSAWPSLGK